MQKTAGMLFFLGGSVVILGIMTAEIFYPPGYNISLNMISNLAATPPPDSIVRQPSAGIFDSAMIVAGILIASGAYFLSMSKFNKQLVGSIALMGICAAGVGFFPAYHAIIHPVIALVTFLAGGIAAVISAKHVTSPFRFVAVSFGAISLLGLMVGVLLPDIIVPVLGRGGVERWIAYPILLWIIGFGGYLMNVRKD